MAFSFPWTNRVDNQDYVMADDVNTLAAGVQAAGEHADELLGGLQASDVSLSSTNFTSTNVKDALDELFTSVSDGKTALVADIEAKGGTVTQVGDVPTFEELSAGIESIPVGGGLLTSNISLPISVDFGTSVSTDVQVIV